MVLVVKCVGKILLFNHDAYGEFTVINNKDSSSPLTVRDYGYLIAMTILGISIGLLLYPSLRYPAVWQWATAVLSIILMVLTMPALRKRR